MECRIVIMKKIKPQQLLHLMVLTISSMLLHFTGFAQIENMHEPIDSIITKSKRALLNGQSFCYLYDYKSKFANRNDTSYYYGTAILERNMNDTLLGCTIDIKNKFLANGITYSFDAFYNGTKTYTINHHNTTVTIDDSEKNGTLFSSGQLLTNNIIYKSVMHIYADQEPYQDWFNKTVTAELLNPQDKISIGFYKIKFSSRTSNNQEKKFTVYYIDKKDYLPKRRIVYQERNNQVEYSDLILSQITLNSIKPQEATEFPTGYDIEYLANLNQTKADLLPKGTTAPFINAVSYLTGESITTQAYKGKVVLLDFWYSNCYPCKKSMPLLEQLHLKYKDKGLQLVGINPIDKNKSVEEISSLLRNNGITYLNGYDYTRGTALDYQVVAYPTLYLINKEGKIAFSSIGFDVDKFMELDNQIQLLLNE